VGSVKVKETATEIAILGADEEDMVAINTPHLLPVVVGLEMLSANELDLVTVGIGTDFDVWISAFQHALGDPARLCSVSTASPDVEVKSTLYIISHELYHVLKSAEDVGIFFSKEEEPVGERHESFATLFVDKSSCGDFS